MNPPFHRSAKSYPVAVCSNRRGPRRFCGARLCEPQQVESDRRGGFVKTPSVPQVGQIMAKRSERVEGKHYHFYAADIELNGNAFSPSFELDGFLLSGAPALFRPLQESSMTAVWVRARVPKV